MDRPPVHYTQTADGVAIAYSDFGQGPPLIEVPQGGWTHLVLWEVPRIRRFYERLARRCRVITYDARGVGLSQRGEFEYDEASHTADLEAVLAGAQVQPANLLATHIMGAFAVTYAAQRPQRVRRLLLADTWLNGPEFVRTRPYNSLRPLMSTDPELFIRYLMQGQANMPVEDVDKQIAALLPLKNGEPLARLFAAQHAVDARDAAQRCSVPARVIRHGDARSPGREFVLEVAQLLPNAEFVEIDGPNHYLEYGPLDDTIELITSWLVTLDDTQAPLGAAGGGESNSSAIDTDLTPRETDVLRLLAQGRRTAEIAETLTISPHTVTRHVSNVLRKTGCSNRVEATRWAMDHGLLDDED